MIKQQCANCAAPMQLFNNQDGSEYFKCPYCGNVINIQSQQQPQSVLDKVFTFARKIIPNSNEELNRLHAERDRLMAIINDPSSTKETVKFAKKQLKQITYEINCR